MQNYNSKIKAKESKLIYSDKKQTSLFIEKVKV